MFQENQVLIITWMKDALSTCQLEERALNYQENESVNGTDESSLLTSQASPPRKSSDQCSLHSSSSVSSCNPTTSPEVQ